MMKVNPYLNFDGNAEEAFNFYKSVFGGEFQGIFRMSDAPPEAQVKEEDKNRVMHVSLPIGDGVTLMASDTQCSSNQQLIEGNNFHISLHPDSKGEADRLFNALSAGGKVVMPIGDTFWGDYWGSLVDKFGIQWMVNYSQQR